jgi:hypothetical protein
LGPIARWNAFGGKLDVREKVRRDKPPSGGDENGVVAATDPQLQVDLLEMGLHRARGDLQTRANLSVR